MNPARASQVRPEPPLTDMKTLTTTSRMYHPFFCDLDGIAHALPKSSHKPMYTVRADLPSGFLLMIFAAGQFVCCAKRTSTRIVMDSQI